MAALQLSLTRPAMWGTLALASTNLPVALKYAGAPGAAAYLAAMGICAGAAALGWPRTSTRRWIAAGALLAMVIGQLLLLGYIAPMYDANMDRDDALVLWWQRLAQGIYPYAGPTSAGNPISVLPALHLAALPFVLLGNVGYLPIAANVALAALLWRRYAGRPRIQAFTLLTLISAPIVNFEVAGRSDLVANMLLFLLLLTWIERVVQALQAQSSPLPQRQPTIGEQPPNEGRCSIVGSRQHEKDNHQLVLASLGLFAGAVAATRFAIWPALVAPIVYLLSRLSWRGRTAVLAGALLGFALLVAPFAIWNPAVFFGYAPFGVNATKLGTSVWVRLFWLTLTLAATVGATIYAWRTGRLFAASVPVLACITLATWLTFFYDVSYVELLFVPLLCSFARKATR